MTFELNMKKKIYLIKEKTKGITNSFFSPNRSTDSWAFPSDINNLSVNKNSITDLLKYNENSTIQSRWGFLEKAFLLVSKGAEFYTVTDKKRLLACIWMSANDQLDEDETVSEQAIESYFHSIFKHNKSAFEKYVFECERALSSDKSKAHHENS